MGIISTLFPRDKTFIKNKEFMERMSLEECCWVFDPSSIRVRMDKLLEADNLDRMKFI